MIKNEKGISLIVLIVIAIVVIIVGALAIILFINSGNNKPTNITNTTNIVHTNNQVNNTSKSEEKSNKKTNNNSSILSDITYKVPMENVYMNVPNWQSIEEGLTQVYIVQPSKYVAITGNWKAKSKASSVQEAHKICFDKFKTNMDNYQGGVNSLTISKNEEGTINGIKMYKFEGTINYGKSNVYDGYAIGYSFILDDVPCEIIGSVIDKSQSEQLIKEVKDTVNEMIKTVRTTE